MFRGKIRKPVSLTLTPEHHRKVTKRRGELGLSRADFIGLLIDKYADAVTTEYVSAYARLRHAVDALGGNLTHKKPGEPQGGSWVLRLGGKTLTIPSEQARRYRLLDNCYCLKEGVAESRTWEDHVDTIEPRGLAELFAELARTGTLDSSS